MDFPIEKLEHILGRLGESEQSLIFFLVELRKSSLFYRAHRPIAFNFRRNNAVEHITGTCLKYDVRHVIPLSVARHLTGVVSIR